jgi:hypothetical protein
MLICKCADVQMIAGVHQRKRSNRCNTVESHLSGDYFYLHISTFAYLHISSVRGKIVFLYDTSPPDELHRFICLSKSPRQDKKCLLRAMCKCADVQMIAGVHQRKRSNRCNTVESHPFRRLLLFAHQHICTFAH